MGKENVALSAKCTKEINVAIAGTDFEFLFWDYLNDFSAFKENGKFGRDAGERAFIVEHDPLTFAVDFCQAITSYQSRTIPQDVFHSIAPRIFETGIPFQVFWRDVLDYSGVFEGKEFGFTMGQRLIYLRVETWNGWPQDFIRRFTVARRNQFNERNLRVIDEHNLSVADWQSLRHILASAGVYFQLSHMVRFCLDRQKRSPKDSNLSVANQLKSIISLGTRDVEAVREAVDVLIREGQSYYELLARRGSGPGGIDARNAINHMIYGDYIN